MQWRIQNKCLFPFQLNKNKQNATCFIFYVMFVRHFLLDKTPSVYLVHTVYYTFIPPPSTLVDDNYFLKIKTVIVVKVFNSCVTIVAASAY